MKQICQIYELLLEVEKELEIERKLNSDLSKTITQLQFKIQDLESELAVNNVKKSV